MIAYGDMCSGYMPAYETDNWGWVNHPWGSGYEQVHYDCSFGHPVAWEFQHQAQQQLQQMQPMQQLPVSTSQQTHATHVTQVNDQMHLDQQNEPEELPQSQQLLPEQSSKPQQRWCETSEVAGPKAGAELLTELRLAELKRLIDRDSHALKRTEADDSRAPTLQDNAALPTSAPPRPVQRYVVLADFLPESRTYGEMPVRAGDEVFVREEPTNDWIYGVQMGTRQDEGWFPAMNIGIGLDEDDEECAFSTEADEHAEADWRGTAEGSCSTGAVGSGHAAGHGRSNRKSGVADGPVSSTREAADSVPVAADSQSWHQHGNWWSRQRHLKVSAKGQSCTEEEWHRRHTKEADTESIETRATATTSAASAVSAVSFSSASGSSAPSPAQVGCGRGTGRGGGRGLAERRTRPCLSSLMDRLNKPLQVVSKPSAKEEFQN